MFFISVSGDVMCLHQLENHEPVEFGEIGIDPVERDQVTPFIHSQDICIASYILNFEPSSLFEPLAYHRSPSILMTLPD